MTEYEMLISDWSSDLCSSDLCKINMRDRNRGIAMPVLLTHHVIVRPPLFAAMFALLLAGSVLLPPPAAAQDNQALIDRVNRLQADLHALQRQVYRGGTPPAALPSDGTLVPTGASGPSGPTQLA